MFDGGSRCGVDASEAVLLSSGDHGGDGVVTSILNRLHDIPNGRI